MLARHASDLIGPSSGAFCTSCIRRLWYVVIRVLLDTSSRYKVVGKLYSQLLKKNLQIIFVLLYEYCLKSSLVIYRHLPSGWYSDVVLDLCSGDCRFETGRRYWLFRGSTVFFIFSRLSHPSVSLPDSYQIWLAKCKCCSPTLTHLSSEEFQFFFVSLANLADSY